MVGIGLMIFYFWFLDSKETESEQLAEVVPDAAPNRVMGSVSDIPDPAVVKTPTDSAE